MSIENLDKIFHPKTIAVVGASERKGSIGHALMHNLVERGFPGEIYPINPKHKKIWGKPACSTIAELKNSVDLVVIATPIVSAPQLVKECTAAGVGGVVIISAGGKEIGEEGKKIEAAIRKEAEASGLRIIGPNCVGVVSSQSKLNASFAHQMPLPGKMAFISQSGAICTAILDLSIKENIGFSHFVSLGDMLDVDFGDMIDYLGGERDVNSIVMYVESLSRFRKFMSAARAVSRVKPIVVLKAGRTQAGALAAASHTGAMAGEDAVYDAAFQRAGILRVKTFEELFDCAELLAKQPRPQGPGLAIITNAGGPGVMAADTLSDYGYDPVTLSNETIKKIDAILPPYWSNRNPIDMLGDSTPEHYQKVVEICLGAKEVNGILIISAPQALTDTAVVASNIVDIVTNKPLPIFTSWIGGTNMQKGRKIFNQAGIPTFDTPERAVRAFMDLCGNTQKINMHQEFPTWLPKRLEFDRDSGRRIVFKALQQHKRILNETESKSLLSAYGIPVNLVKTATSAEEAVEKASKVGFPVALKVNSRDITHKSDAKAVFLNLNDEYAVRNAFKQAIHNAKTYKPEAKIDGVSIQQMVKSIDYELILGVKKDRDFGPVILFGMGGIYTEVLEDHAIAFPPLNRLLARKLIEQTKVYRLLQGYRNTPPANLELLEEILIRLAQLAADFSEIEELDINPLILKATGACAVDARVLLKPSHIPAPLHLAISPYPDQYETNIRTATGIDIFVRPIRPEDAPLLSALFNSLSQRSVYMRFFTPLKHISQRMLARFTQIDYDREIALVAFSRSDAEEKMLGVGRVISERNLKNAEFAVLVSDAWQGKGIGAALLKRCLSIAAEQHIDKIWGTVLSENTQMLALGKKLGFHIKRTKDAGEYE
jgi:acetyltransferase